MDMKDTMDMVVKAQKGFELLQDNLDHPLVKEGLGKINDIDAIKKLKDIDVNEGINKLRDLTENLGDAKKHAENMFKLFQ